MPPPNKRPRLGDPEFITSIDGILQIRPDADTVLEVGMDSDTSKKTLMRINKETVMKAIPFFEKMLGERWAQGGEEDGSKEKPYKLPEDGGRAVELVMKAVHGTLTSITDIGLDDLPALLVTCDKYDCVNLFRPYYQGVLHKWFRASGTYFGNGQSKHFREVTSHLYIAYLMEDEDLFANIGRKVLLKFSPADVRKDKYWSPEILQIVDADFREGLALATQYALRRAANGYRYALVASVPAMSMMGKANQWYGPKPCAVRNQRVMDLLCLLKAYQSRLPDDRMPLKHDDPKLNMQNLNPLVLGAILEQSYPLTDALFEELCEQSSCLCHDDSLELLRKVPSQLSQLVGTTCLHCFQDGYYELDGTYCKHARAIEAAEKLANEMAEAERGSTSGEEYSEHSDSD